MVAKDTKPYSVSQEDWDILWFNYPNYMQKIYDISQELPGFAGLRYKRIDDEIAQLYLYPEYKAILIHWRNQLLSTTPADSTPMLTPNNITRQIVVCKG